MWSTLRKKTTTIANASSSDNKKADNDSNPTTNKPVKKPHHVGNGTYKNPWPSAAPTPRWMPTFQIPFAWAQQPHASLKRVKVVKPDFDKQSHPNELKATWLGHAGVLVQLPPLKEGLRPITIAIDPIFSERASPSQYAGPGRFLPAPCTVDDLPHLDFIFISHNHYDHLDYPTIDKLIRKSGPGTRFVVPLGLKVWFIGCKVPEDQIVEMDWWDESTFQPEEMYEASESAGVASTSDVKGKGKATPEDATAEEAAKVTAISQSLEAFESDEDTDDEKHGLGSGFASLNKLGSLRISCVPAQHNSARTGLDKCTTLWAGFVIEQFACKPSPAPSRTTVYFAGDTGYRAEPGGPTCPAFEQIGRRYGPMDFSAIPIWRGGTLNFVSYMGVRLHHEALTLATHATPGDALCIHSDVLSRSSIAIHFATFAGSDDEATYPIVLLDDACREAGASTDAREDGGFGVTHVGETLVIPVRPMADAMQDTTKSSSHQ